jgi:hypothetical protein
MRASATPTRGTERLILTHADDSNRAGVGDARVLYRLREQPRGASRTPACHSHTNMIHDTHDTAWSLGVPDVLLSHSNTVISHDIRYRTTAWRPGRPGRSRQQEPSRIADFQDPYPLHRRASRTTKSMNSSLEFEPPSRTHRKFSKYVS